MSKRVILSLGRGSLEKGFREVSVQLWVESESLPRLKLTSDLPPAPEIAVCYREWQMLHKAFSQRLSRRAGIEIVGSFTNVSEQDFPTLSQRLKQAINDWLDRKDFRDAEKELRTALDKEDEILVIVETNDNLVRRLPWHLWKFFEDYQNAEIVLSHPEFKKVNSTSKTPANSVKILGILGDRRGIDIDADQKLLQGLEGAVPHFLVEKERQDIDSALWKEAWDILFFAGHSETQTEDGQGKIYINSQPNHNTLTIEQLENALKEAIKQGLILAIFNSCDGLGLASKLAKLNLPHIIVMREDVPNKVAQEFLKYFLEEYANQGVSLALAVRRARERLQGLENDFPCASWLPVLCQNPATVVPTWQELLGVTPSPFPTIQFRSVLLLSLAVASLCTGVLMGIRHLGMLQAWELGAYDLFMRSRPQEAPDPRLLVITVDEQDIQYQNRQKMQGGGSLTADATARVMAKLEQYQARTIGLDIYRDLASDPATLVTQMQKSDRLFAVCKVSDPKENIPGIAPPRGIPKQRQGFSDVVVDNDDVLRRQLLNMEILDPTSPCRAENAFSLMLALHYLASIGIKPTFTPDRYLQLGYATFKRLETHMGGYQGIDNSGYQILLNYRSLASIQDIAQQVTLSQFLEEPVAPEAVKDKIVLIGVTSPTSGDYWLTPYGNQTDQKVPGVFIQAQMVSQIVSTALGERRLIWVLPLWGETLWIWGCSFIGGIIAGYCPRFRMLGVVGGTCLGILVCGSWLIFTQAGWIPVVPGAIAFILTGGIVKIIQNSKSSF
ncbi:MAG: CHASE2 domain-containing protein [Chlorogloeopsis fritschii C42_A2020_084]|uniref:CHASE2 domain-containing protein n=1 Tax=Chlorogloeopsis fritschii TaxID=1124 RepID=UPI0019F005FD|nr:CHASE2 domain-containing protein [Chlorogloeopsis fritschii]MBF2005543.1 CHASE2 domain-containing protein [Chlorogloeopsis fritschii C42_A2020_084]